MTDNQTPPANDKAPVAKTDAEVIRENELLKAKVDKLEKYLAQAIDIANKANDAQKAREEAEIQDLTERITVHSNNKYNADSLKGKSLQDLRLIETVLETSRDDTFASVAALQAEKNKKTQPYLTVGYVDTATGKWKGGL